MVSQFVVFCVQSSGFQPGNSTSLKKVKYLKKGEQRLIEENELMQGQCFYTVVINTKKKTAAPCETLYMIGLVKYDVKNLLIFIKTATTEILLK